jgi:hypothetical protein
MRNKLQSFAAVTAANAGFHAVAGPYDTNSPSDRIKARDTAFCESSLADQRKLCRHARKVDHYGKTWIIRKLPLELDNGKRNKQNVAGNFGIYAGRMAGV